MPKLQNNWQIDLQEAYRSADSLLRYLELDASQGPEWAPDPAFPLLVSRSFAGRMRKGDWRDPLLLQVLPQRSESETPPGFRADAVGDLAAEAAPGLLRKYGSRALLLASPNCAIHCRYCFRREFPYGDMPKARWEEAWLYLENHPEVEELILSGGDPLFLDNTRLETLVERALSLASLRTLRIHTRLPVALPARVDPGLVELLAEAAVRKTLVLVVHANHPRELEGDCLDALAALRSTGALLLNQSVLLRGINDEADTLIELSRRLLARGVLPYYLHQLDRVTGTAHFEVEEARGLEILAEMRRQLPGYAVPKYVRETPGAASKEPIGF